jgi:hypothetical protein
VRHRGDQDDAAPLYLEDVYQTHKQVKELIQSSMLYPEDGNAVTSRVVLYLESWREAVIAKDEYPAPRREDVWLVLPL